MGTGYTHKLMDKGMEFNDFVLSCARAFGACVELRDSNIDKAPRKIESENDKYHKGELAKAKKELAKFKALSKAGKDKWAEAEKAKSIKESSQYLVKQLDENSKLLEMKFKVDDWTPPTTEHEGLKDFMIQQIDISKNDISYAQKELAKVKTKSLAKYTKERLSELKWSLNYHKKEIGKAKERDTERNEWLENLYKSLGL